jgi:glycosyltransferase involved in cell wall biosynthesis
MSRGILIVAPYLPWPADFGGAIRIYQFIKNMSHDHHVILLAPAAPEDLSAIEHLRHICDVTAVPVNWTFRQAAGMHKRVSQARSMLSRSSFVELAPPNAQFQSVMDRLFMTRHIDLVQYEFPQMARFRPLRPCPTILDNHNVEHELLARVARSAPSLPQRLFNNAEWRKVRRLERHAWASVTLNIATSDRDAERIQAATGAAVPVVPNGVDVNAYSNGQPSERMPGRVVFVGAMRHQPNASGARWYAEQVHPLVVEAVPGATFEIVGADPPPDVAALANDSVTVTGRVDSVTPHLTRASVAVVPLAAGGGTRLKLLEAFAAGVPVVSTSVGAEGLDVQRDRDLLIAGTPRGFADAVIRVLRGADLPPGYSTTNGRRLVQSNYDWQSAVVPALVAAHDVAIERFERAQTSPQT